MEETIGLDLHSNTSLPIWRKNQLNFYFSGQQESIQHENLLGLVVSLILIPTVSVLGVVGNILTALISRAHGLKRSYNILILALSVGDGIFLAGVNNVVLIIYMRLGTFGLHYQENLSLFLYVCFHIQNGLDFSGRYLAMTLPTLITFERFVAVYFPLRLSRIVTPFRTRLSVLLICIAPLPFFVYFQSLHRFGYLFDPATNTTAGYIMRSDVFLTNFQAYLIVARIYFFISGPLPNIIVLFGCVAIGAKINTIIKSRPHVLKWTDRTSIVSNNNKDFRSGLLELPAQGSLKFSYTQSKPKQKVDFSNLPIYNIPSLGDDSGLDLHDKRPKLQMTHFRDSGSKKSTAAPVAGTPMTRDDVNKPMRFKTNQIRTTVMLVSSCVVYTVTVSMKNIPTLFFTTSDWESNTGYVIERCSQLAVCLNSATNILIYIAFNSRYRHTLKQLLCRGR